MTTDTPIAADFCGQQQPHAAHVWQQPAPFGSTTLARPRQCSGTTLRVGSGCQSGCVLARVVREDPDFDMTEPERKPLPPVAPAMCTCGNPLGPHQNSCQREVLLRPGQPGATT